MHLDDVVVVSKTVAEHVHHLDIVLTLLRDAFISLKLKNASFFNLWSAI